MNPKLFTIIRGESTGKYFTLPTNIINSFSHFNYLEFKIFILFQAELAEVYKNKIGQKPTYYSISSLSKILNTSWKCVNDSFNMLINKGIIIKRIENTITKYYISIENVSKLSNNNKDILINETVAQGKPITEPLTIVSTPISVTNIPAPEAVVPIEKLSFVDIPPSALSINTVEPLAPTTTINYISYSHQVEENKTYIFESKNKCLIIPEAFQEVARKLYLLIINKAKITDLQFRSTKTDLFNRNPEFVNWLKTVALTIKMNTFISGKKLLQQNLLENLDETKKIAESINEPIEALPEPKKVNLVAQPRLLTPIPEHEGVTPIKKPLLVGVIAPNIESKPKVIAEPVKNKLSQFFDDSDEPIIQKEPEVYKPIPYTASAPMIFKSLFIPPTDINKVEQFNDIYYYFIKLNIKENNNVTKEIFEKIYFLSIYENSPYIQKSINRNIEFVHISLQYENRNDICKYISDNLEEIIKKYNNSFHYISKFQLKEFQSVA